MWKLQVILVVKKDWANKYKVWFKTCFLQIFNLRFTTFNHKNITFSLKKKIIHVFLKVKFQIDGQSVYRNLWSCPYVVYLSNKNLFIISLKMCPLFYISKRQRLWKKKKCFLFHFQSSFCSRDNQILTFQVFKCYDVLRCLSMEHETHFTE